VNIAEYKKQNTLHVELPSGLVFDCKAPNGLLVSRWHERIQGMDAETKSLEIMGVMLQEFEHCFPDGLKLEDFTADDYASLIGIALPFFSVSPYPSQFGSAKNSNSDISTQGAGPTIS